MPGIPVLFPHRQYRTVVVLGGTVTPLVRVGASSELEPALGRTMPTFETGIVALSIPVALGGASKPVSAGGRVFPAVSVTATAVAPRFVLGMVAPVPKSASVAPREAAGI